MKSTDRTILYAYRIGNGRRIATLFESKTAPGIWYVRLDTVIGPTYLKDDKGAIKTYNACWRAKAAMARAFQMRSAEVMLKDLATF